MQTNGTANPENYYRIRFGTSPSYDTWAYGATALEAIETARLDVDGQGNATARPAVYKEWDYGTDRFTNGGGFIRGGE